MAPTSKTPRFKSKYITAELAHLFSQSDSENEEFEGFSPDEDQQSRGCFNKRSKTKVVDSEEDSDENGSLNSDGEEPHPPKRRSLLVALKFPVKKLSSPKLETQEKKADRPVKKSPPVQTPRGKLKKKQQQQQQQRDEDDEEEKEKEDILSLSLKKRDKNIQENKAMLAKLFAGLSTMADLTLPTTTPQKKKKQGADRATPKKRKIEMDLEPERRNPSRKARPPENFGVEANSDLVNIRSPRTIDVKRLVEVDEELACMRQKKRNHSRRSTYCGKSVDEITEEDLANIAYRSKDKIWDKENGSSCHQCRQKTLDTKTVCRSGFCAGGKGQFCGPCLKNRYGEDVRAVLLDPNWSCPICRGMCNCSLCRKKEGRCATGILVGLARYNGHDNVHEYLESIQKELQ